MATTNSTTNTAQTSAYSYLQYKNKIGGLVSGMDIDSLMEKLMKAESAQMEKLQQQKTKYEWKRDAYREVNTKLSTFEQSAFTDYGLKSSWNTKSVTVSNDAVSATATSAANGTLNISEAKVATAGQQIVSMTSTKFSPDSVIELQYNDGRNISISKDDTLNDVVRKLNDSGDFKAEIVTNEDRTQTLKVKSLKELTISDTDKAVFEKLGFTTFSSEATPSTKLKISQDAQGEIAVPNAGAIKAKDPISILGIDKAGEFTIGAINDKGEYTEKTIKYELTDTISDVMNRINSSGVGVTAIVSENGLSLTANTEGTGNKGSIYIAQKKDANGNETGELLDEGGLFSKLGVHIESNGQIAAGTNGYVVANGIKIEGVSNKYTISGYEVSINKNIAASDAPSKITSTTDTDAIVDKVKKFVDSYNELIADLNKRTTEKKNTSYPPLTDAQKAEMKPEEITKWEEKAKAGLLKGDSTLNNVLSSMRSTLSTYGNGTTDMLYSLGISTSSSYSDNGKLVIDEDKLKEALSSDPDKVARIFAGDSSTGAEGIISKMRTTIKDAVATIKNTAGSETSTSDVTYSLGKTLTSLNSKIDDWKDRLKDIEERYWNQFSAMEKAIQKANSQTSIFDSY